MLRVHPGSRHPYHPAPAQAKTKLRPSGQATKQAVTFPRGCAMLQMLPTPKMNPEQTAGLAGLLGTRSCLGWLLSGAAAVCRHRATTATIGATRMHGPTSVSWGLGGFISCRGQREAGFCGVGTARGFVGGTGRALRPPNVVALHGQLVRREDKCGISNVVNRDRTRSFLAVEPFLLLTL